MSAFGDALLRFNVTADHAVRDVFVDVTREVKRSLVEGSEITGAPGQPVRTGNLKNSFVDEFTSPETWEVTTNVEYAPHIEAGGNDRGPFDPSRGDPRSEVGGYHSAALTVAGFDRLVDVVAARVAARPA